MNFEIPPMDQLITKSLAIVAIIVGAFIVRFLLGRALNLIAEKTRLTRSDVAPIHKVVGWLVLAVTIILVLTAVGVPLTGVWALLSTVLAMVAIGFVAVWSVLSNISCTMLILIFRPFSVGDDVELAGEEVKGRVVDLNFLFTTLEAPDGTVVQIPNNLFFQKVLKRRKGTGSVSLAEQLQTEGPAEA